MTQQLSGKVAVVTGGSTGIGLAMAKRFTSEGATVFITGRREAELEAAARAAGPNAIGVRADMSSQADLDHLFETVRTRAGKIDVLAVNAGGGEFAPLGAIDAAHFDKTFATNVRGALFTVQTALPLLADGASVILTGSTMGSKGAPAFGVYGATKAAVRNLARTWMLELKDRGIRVNVLSPGPIDTPGLHGLGATEAEAQGLKEGLRQSVPLGRLGRPEEVASAALFLASDQSSFVNGSELFVDGGAAQY
jgi:NAD(P)-dependent dehydrogenase (short-subunit alcohol dehydrogenase family)